jgi:DNA-directed RNA polymerase specialized sigma24 family protein
MTTKTISEGAAPAMARFHSLSAAERLVAANSVLDELRNLMSAVADSRRVAVRELRTDGYSLKDIADMVGTTPQRIHQIESGYNRKEKAARKRP